jgi:hypothetical protein
MVSARALALLAALCAGLAGCATAVETRPFRTATEQLLVTHAAEKAAAKFAVTVPDGAKVFLDTVNFQGEGADYAASAIREAIVRRGAVLAEDRARADVIIEVRLGALSIDQMQRVLGIPALTLPTAPNLTTVTIPELSIYSRRDRTGVAEFSAFAYDARTGRPISVAGRVAGTTRIRSHTLLMILPWGQQEIRPGDPALRTAPWWKPW